MEAQFPRPQGEDESTAINFHIEHPDFQLPPVAPLDHWVRRVIELEEAELRTLNFIFVTDDALHQMNVTHLQHDTLTDIITFPFAEPPVVEGDVYISIDRVRDNAEELRVSFTEELRRIIIHGVLHLCGQGDKSLADKTMMTAKENAALRLWSELV